MWDSLAIVNNIMDTPTQTFWKKTSRGFSTRVNICFKEVELLVQVKLGKVRLG